MKPTVGLIGLGLMGKPMGRNLLKAGFPLVVWNRTAARADELVSEGAKLAANPREVAAAGGCADHDRERSAGARRSPMGQRDGALEGLRRGSVLIDSSTISPELARRVAAACGECGVDFLDAPVTGGDWGAKKGELVFMVGGKAEVLERVKPVLEAVGKKFFLLAERCGADGEACDEFDFSAAGGGTGGSAGAGYGSGRDRRAIGGGDAIEHGARGGAGCESAADAEE